MPEPSAPPRVTLWGSSGPAVHTGTCRYRTTAHYRLQATATTPLDQLNPNAIAATIALTGRTGCKTCKPMARIDQQARADRRRREDERNR